MAIALRLVRGAEVRTWDALAKDKSTSHHLRIDAQQHVAKGRGKNLYVLVPGRRLPAIIDLKSPKPPTKAKRLLQLPSRDYWLVGRRVYETTDTRLTAADVQALANVAENRRRLELQRAHALQAMVDRLSEPRGRRKIPTEVKVAVWQRDGGRCVECKATTNLEFDHVIPVALGGADTMRNLQLLCADCNRRKGATLG